MSTIQVRMNQKLVGVVDTAVKHGLYQNRSEVLRDAVRTLFAPELKPEIWVEAYRISREMDNGKQTTQKDIEEEFL